MRQPRRKGQTLVEFALVCIPLIFILISIVELSRFMWSYHTLAFAVERGAQYAVVHGQTSSTSVSAVASIIRNAAPGLDPGQLTVALQRRFCHEELCSFERLRQSGISVAGLYLQFSRTIDYGGGSLPIPLCLKHVLAWDRCGAIWRGQHGGRCNRRDSLLTESVTNEENI